MAPCGFFAMVRSQTACVFWERLSKREPGRKYIFKKM